MAQKVSSLAIDINVTGAPQASKALTDVESKGAGAAASLGKMGAQGAAAAVALGAVTMATRKLLEAAEEYNKINNRIALVTTTTKQAAEVTEELYSVAQKTGVAMGEVATMYGKIALNSKALNATQSQMLQLVENTVMALRISGANAAEAAGSTQQFVQMLGSSRVQAEELNSILDGNAFLAQMIAKGLGMTPGELREAVKAGKVLNTQVMEATLRMTSEINAKFGLMGGTMEASGQRLANSFTRALAVIDNKIGASSRLASFFDYLSGKIDGTAGFGTGGATPASGRGMTAGDAATRAQANRSLGASIAAERARVRASLARGGSGRRGGQSVGTRAAPTPRPVLQDPGANPSPLGAGTLGAGLMDAARSQRMSSAIGSVNGMGFAGGNIAETIGNDIAAQFGPLQDRIATLGQGIGLTLTDSIANGITAAVQSGSIAAGFAELGRTLVGGLGAAVRDFGVQSLAASTLMAKIQSSLASFIPGGAIAASVAMIALGSAMVGLAGRGARSSFGTTNTGINRGATQSSTIVERGTLSSSIYGGGMASSGASNQMASGSPVMVNATIIGYNDPRAQRDIQELVKRASARGAV